MTESPDIIRQDLKPYKDKGVQVVIQKYAHEFADRLSNVQMPKLSANPDEMETWEAQAIDKRKQRIAYEGDFPYVLRVLYEETFSVNQFAGEPFKFSNGLTIGGLVSHFYSGSRVSGISLEDAKNWNLDGKTLKEVLLKTEDFRDRENIYDVAELITFPLQLGRGGGNHMMRLDGPLKVRLLKDPDKYGYRQDVDTFGFRLMKLVNLVPELTEEVQDLNLLSLVGYPEGRKISRIQFFARFWQRLSGLVLDEGGYYKREVSEGVDEGLKELAMIRTHPEFQFLYKYKSPSGYINEDANNDKIAL